MINGIFTALGITLCITMGVCLGNLLSSYIVKELGTSRSDRDSTPVWLKDSGKRDPGFID